MSALSQSSRTTTATRSSLLYDQRKQDSAGSSTVKTLEEEFLLGVRPGANSNKVQMLDRILEDDSLRCQFRVFLSTRRAEENLAFLGAIRSLTTGNVRKVYLWYLFDDSPFEINLTAQTTDELITTYLKQRGLGSSSEWYRIFTPARNEIHNILTTMANEFVAWARGYYVFWRTVIDSRKKVLVIGGGPCGIVAAKMLEAMDVFKVTMVTKTNFVEFNPATIHVTHPGRFSKFHVPLADALSRTDIVLGEVTAVEQNRAFIGSYEVDFDYVVLACGKSYSTGPTWGNNAVTKEYRERVREAGANEIYRASSILIVGGGPVGVSTAAEIKLNYPQKNVVLLQNSNVLLKNESWGPLMGKLAQEHLDRLGVIVYTGKLVSATISDSENAGYYYVHTADGLAFHVDMVISARPPVVNSFILKKKDVKIDEDGYLVVPRTMNIPDTTHMYAGGAVCKSSDPYDMTIINSMITGCIIARNICRDYKGKELSYHGHKGFPEYIRKDADPLASVMVGDRALGRTGLVALGKKTPEHSTHGLPSPAESNHPDEVPLLQDVELTESFRNMHVDAYTFWYNTLMNNERHSWLGEEPRKLTLDDYKGRRRD